MNYYISDNTRIVKISGVPVIGNIHTGSFIALTKEGYALVQQIRSGENIDSDNLSENLRDLIIAGLDSGIILKSANLDESPSRLSSAYIHITNQCNLHCVGCYSDDNRRNKAIDLPLDKIKFIIGKLGENGVKTLIISGGEPFLRRDLVDILRYAKSDHSMRIIIATNGTIINKELYLELPNLVERVSVSIDGFSKESADIIRDNGTFERVVKTINMMKEYGIPISILPTLHKKNYKDIGKYISFAKELGVPISFSILTCNHPDNPIWQYVISEDEFTEFMTENCTDSTIISDTPINLNEMSFKMTCGAGKTMVSVDASGDVYPCHMLQTEAFKLGNIFKSSLDDLLKKTNNVSNINVENTFQCSKCEYRYLCGGGCKARRYYNTGNIAGSEIYCEGYKKSFQKFSDMLSVLKSQNEL